jgi:hypothetical protein
VKLDRGSRTLLLRNGEADHRGTGDGMMIRCLAALVVALAVGLVAAPAVVDAQPTGKVHRIGYLGSGSSTSGFQAVFRQELRELG